MDGREGLKPMGTLLGDDSECFVGELDGYLRSVAGNLGDLGSLCPEFLCILVTFYVPP